MEYPSSSCSNLSLPPLITRFFFVTHSLGFLFTFVPFECNERALPTLSRGLSAPMSCLIWRSRLYRINPNLEQRNEPQGGISSSNILNRSCLRSTTISSSDFPFSFLSLFPSSTTAVMNANLDDVTALRAEIDELKQQRQELRQLSTYREAELLKIKEEAKAAQGRVEQLTKDVDNMRAREMESSEERKKIGETMLRMAQEQSRVSAENDKNKGLHRGAAQQIGELKGNIQNLEAEHRAKLAEKAAEVVDLQDKLRIAEGDTKDYQQKWKEERNLRTFGVRVCRRHEPCTLRRAHISSVRVRDRKNSFSVTPRLRSQRPHRQQSGRLGQPPGRRPRRKDQRRSHPVSWYWATTILFSSQKSNLCAFQIPCPLFQTPTFPCVVPS